MRCRIRSPTQERCEWLLNSLVEATTAVAANMSQRLRKYLLSAVTQRLEDKFLHSQLARQTYGTCDFILETEAFRDWQNSRGSAFLGLVGGPGSGKTLLSAFLYDKMQLLASPGAPVIFFHCDTNLCTNPFDILRSLTWRIIEQRPDLLLKHLNDKTYHIRLFRKANSFELLWPIFCNLVKSVPEMWIIIDSIHQCDETRSRFIEKVEEITRTVGGGRRLKVIVTGRHLKELTCVSNSVLTYTAQDMNRGLERFVNQELSVSRNDEVELPSLIQEATETVIRTGGGLLRAGAVVQLMKSTPSISTARQLLAQISTIDDIVWHLWQYITRSDEDVSLIRAIACILRDAQGHMTSTEIYNTLVRECPEGFKNPVGVEKITSLLKSQFWGLLETGNGQYRMCNAVREIMNRQPEYLHPENQLERRYSGSQVKPKRIRRPSEDKTTPKSFKTRAVELTEMFIVV